jgi:hypothetical protein
VRISWLTVRDIAADAQDFGAVIGAHRRFAPGDPARRTGALDLLVVHAGSVGEHRHRPLLAHQKDTAMADEGIFRAAGEGAESIVGIGDASLAVVAHDQIALRLKEIARTLFGFAQLPMLIEKIFEPRLQPAYLTQQRASADQQYGNDRAGNGEQRGDADRKIIRVITCRPHAGAGDEADGAGDDR